MTEKRLAFIIVCYFFVTGVLAPQVVTNRKGGYSLDPPVDWGILDEEDPARVAWMSGDLSTGLKVLVYDKQQYSGVKDFYTDIRSQLGAAGEGAEFTYLGFPALLADFRFRSGALSMRGYSLFILGEKYAYALITFSTLAQYERMQDAQLSALDSFALLGQGRLLPGPVSVFLLPSGEEETETYSLKLAGRAYSLSVSPAQRQVSRDIINREARLLAAFPQLNVEAWYRFYRVLYRDNYRRLAAVHELANDRFGKSDKKETLSGILAWLQDFSYQRAGGVADFSSPLDVVTSGEGDCDSVALLFLILTHYQEADTVLLVSPVFGHSAVGLSLGDYPGQGAILEVDGEKYLYTELTAKVKPGMITPDMADPAGWIGFRLGESKNTSG